MSLTRVRGNLQLGDNSVTGDRIRDATITAADIAGSSLEGSVFIDGSIPVEKLDMEALAGDGLVVNPTTKALDVSIDLSAFELLADKLKLKATTEDLLDVDGAVNLADGLVKLDDTGKLPVLDASNLTGLPAGTGDLRADGTIPLTANWDAGTFTITSGFFIGDGSGLTGVGGGSNFVDLETPSGVVDGFNATFTLADTPIAGSVHLFFNGLLMKSGSGNDYTIVGPTITMLVVPSSGSILSTSYRK